MTVQSEAAIRLRVAATEWLRRNWDLLSNFAAIFGATAVTSALGLAFWAVAARMFSEQAVGYSSAAVSAMGVLAIVGTMGLGTVLISELPRRTRRAQLISAAMLAGGIASLLLAVVFSLVAPLVSAQFSSVTGTWAGAGLLMAGVALTAASGVFDMAAIGLARGGLQLWRNTVFAAGKLAILPVTALLIQDRAGSGITLSWVAGTALSMALIALWLRMRGVPVLPRPDWRILRGLSWTVAAHNWVNIGVQVPRLIMPIVATVVVGASANAAFFTAWSLTGLLFLVPLDLATALFAVGSARAQVTRQKLRLSLRLSALAGLAGMLVLGLGARLVLSVFGHTYVEQATVPLLLMLAAYPPTVPKLHYMAICLAERRPRPAAIVLAVTAAAELAAAAVGGAYGGLTGLCAALLAVFVAEGIITSPRVIRVAAGRQ
ncbi:MAG: lipopolysaccharide biosynthesis protein [Gemmatimonadota bacterium]